MNNLIQSNGAVTMTSLEMVEFINSQRAAGEPELTHANFLAKVPKVLGPTSHSFECDLPDSYGRPRKGYRLRKREACLMAMSYSYDLQAKVFDRMTALEHGMSDQIASGTAPKLAGALAIAESFTRMLKPAPSAQVAMLAHIAKDHGINAGFLPSYVVDAAPDAIDGSSMPTAPLTVLLQKHGLTTGPRAYNQRLAKAGFIVERTRKSTSGTDGVKRYWSVTEAGLRYGKNLTNPGNPRETQPHWYVDRFAELHEAVTKGA